LLLITVFFQGFTSHYILKFVENIAFLRLYKTQNLLHNKLISTGEERIMWISTRGRYALRVMIDLAEHNNGLYIPLKDIAKRQEISEKYLESIMVTMGKTGIIKGMRGKGGGYQLALNPVDITVGHVLKATEKSLDPTTCFEEVNRYQHSPDCKTLRIWKEMYKLIDEYIESVTIADLAEEIDGSDFYVI